VCIEGFPLVQGEQEKFSGLLQVVLIDVDAGFGEKSSTYLPRAERILDSVGVEWPNVDLAGGLAETKRLLNVGGYSTILVDANGIVRAIGLHGEELTKQVERMMREWADERLHRDKQGKDGR
jgi:hypothetical protein